MALLADEVRRFREAAGGLGLRFRPGFPGGEAPDVANVCASDSAVVQFAVGAGGKFVDDTPVGSAFTKESDKNEDKHGDLYCIVPLSRVRNDYAVVSLSRIGS
jgi:hypothetical protein